MKILNTFGLAMGLYILASCGPSGGLRSAGHADTVVSPDTTLADGIYLIRDMASGIGEFRDLRPDERVAWYSHDFIGHKDDPVRYYLLQSDPFIPLIIRSAPEVRGTPERLSELYVTLAPEYAELLESFTREHTGEQVAVVLGGMAVTRHKIRRAIEGGRLKISRCTDHACERLLVELENNVQ